MEDCDKRNNVYVEQYNCEINKTIHDVIITGS